MHVSYRAYASSAEHTLTSLKPPTKLGKRKNMHHLIYCMILNISFLNLPRTGCVRGCKVWLLWLKRSTVLPSGKNWNWGKKSLLCYKDYWDYLWPCNYRMIYLKKWHRHKKVICHVWCHTAKQVCQNLKQSGLKRKLQGNGHVFKEQYKLVFSFTFLRRLLLFRAWTISVEAPHASSDTLNPLSMDSLRVCRSAEWRSCRPGVTFELLKPNKMLSLSKKCASFDLQVNVFIRGQTETAFTSMFSAVTALSNVKDFLSWWETEMFRSLTKRKRNSSAGSFCVLPQL